MGSLKFVHLNINNSHLAASQFSNDFCEYDWDIGSINEPYLVRSVDGRRQVASLTGDMKLLHSKYDSRAVMVFNRRVKVIKIFVSENVIAARCKIRDIDIIVITAYLPPATNTVVDRAEQHIEVIKKLIIDFRNEKIVLVGDLNAKSTVWGQRPTNIRGAALLEMIIENQGVIHNRPDSPPTYCGPFGLGWVDLTVTFGIEEDLIRDWAVQDNNNLTDHNAITFEIDMETDTGRMEYRKRWDITNLKWIDFKIALRSSIGKWKENLRSKSLDENVEEVTAGLDQLCRKHRRKGGKRRGNTYWWNAGLTTLRSKVRALRRRYQAERDPDTRKRFELAFKQERARYRREILQAKRTKFKEYLDKVTVKNIFGGVYTIIKDKGNRNILTEGVEDQQGITRFTENEIDRILTEYHFGREDGEEYIGREVTGDTGYITKIEIRKMLEEMDGSKAPGPDGIMLSIIQEIHSIEEEYLQELYNKSIRESYFPKQWKRAQVIFFPKEGKDLKLASAYRPICLLPIMGKILDRIITNRLIEYLEVKGKLSPHQFGFRRNRGTTEALSNIILSLNEGILEILAVQVNIQKLLAMVA